jgi:hypothetical protein
LASRITSVACSSESTRAFRKGALSCAYALANPVVFASPARRDWGAALWLYCLARASAS